jgi:hypothetical protein
MKREHAEALAALFDSERVDPSAVESALADPEAPALLAEMAGLRALAQEDIGRPDDAFYAAMAPILRPRRVNRWWRWIVQPAIAASLLLLAGLTGYSLRPAPAPRLQTTAQPARPEALATSPPASATPVPGGQRAVTPGTHAPEEPRAEAGGPPPASLRLRFSQWQAHVATAGGQPE